MPPITRAIMIDVGRMKGCSMKKDQKKSKKRNPVIVDLIELVQDVMDVAEAYGADEGEDFDTFRSRLEEIVKKADKLKE